MQHATLLPLAQAVSQLVIAIMGVDGTGPISGSQEASAARAFVQQTDAAGNPLLQALLGTLSDPEMPIITVDFATLDTAALLTQLGSAVNAIQGDAAHISGVKEFIRALAEHVAQRAGAGFLGRGDKVTTEEQDFLQQLQRTLEM